MVGFWIRGAQGAIKGVKALKKFKGQKTITQVRNEASAALIKAAKGKLDTAKSSLERTFSKTDKSLKKLKKSVDKTKNLVKHYYPPKDF